MYLIKRLINIDVMKAANNKNPVKERSRGRPANIKSGELQQRLLDTAESLFAEQGYAATSIREMAEHANVNPALVHYYFGTKKDLLIAVMDRALLPLAKAISDMKSAESVNVEDLAGLLFNMLGKHPSMPKLLTREVMLSSGETREIFAKKYAPRLGGALPGLLAKEQKLGHVNSDFDAGTIALMLMSLCIFPFVARSIAEPQLGISYAPDGLEQYLDQIKKLLSNGINP
ncbi:MAG: TetR/AcrR family transcriptional regulator [Lysobacterales bacterium]